MVINKKEQNLKCFSCSFKNSNNCQNEQPLLFSPGDWELIPRVLRTVNSVTYKPSMGC